MVYEKVNKDGGNHCFEADGQAAILRHFQRARQGLCGKNDISGC